MPALARRQLRALAAQSVERPAPKRFVVVETPPEPVAVAVPIELPLVVVEAERPALPPEPPPPEEPAVVEPPSPPKPPPPPRTIVSKIEKRMPEPAVEPEPEELAVAAPAPPKPPPPRKVEHRPKRPTPMSPQQATHHLARAWEKVTGETATLEVIGVFWAQWALETGRGRWMVDYNYAGLKGTAPDGGWAYWWTWEETSSGPHRVRARFRNYDSAEQGALDYVNLLWRLYPKAVLCAKRGDAGAFIAELVDGGFFTEIPKHYTRSVVSLAAEFRRDARALRL